jgi:hypothetical protein
MVEKAPASSADLRAQARRCRSLAAGLLPGEDRHRLNELAASLEAEAGDLSGPPSRAGDCVLAEG